MPGLAGIVRGQSSHSLGAAAGLMNGVMSEDWYQTEQHVDEDAGFAICRSDLGITNTEKQPYVSDHGSILVALHGDVYRRSSQSASVHADCRMEAVIAQDYQQRGANFADFYSGEFLIAVFDRVNQQLILSVDRYGRRPVYFARHGGAFLFASEIKSILAVPGFSPIPDEECLAEFLTFGYILGQKTLLKNVLLLPPSGVLSCNLSSCEFTVSQYWELQQNLDPLSKPDPVLLDEAADSFRNAVDIRMSATHCNGISLSGGMDSRVLAAVADPSRYQIKSVTSGLPGCMDETVTRRIAEASGFEHVFYEFDADLKNLSRSKGSDLMLEAVKRTDGMRGSPSSAMTAYSARKRREYGFNVVLTGHGGEIAKLDNAYSFSIRNADELRQGPDDFFKWAFRRMSRASAPGYEKQGLYQGQLADAMRDAPAQALSQSLSGLDPQLPVAQKVSYLFLNELFRKRAQYALSVHRAFTEIRLPFYDDDFLSLMVRTPYSVRSRRRVHNHIIRSFRPSLMKIPLSDTRISPNPTWAEKLFRGVPVRILKKMGYFKKDFPEDFFQANSDEVFFRGILEDRITAERGLFKPDEISNLIDRNANGRQDVYSLLHLLLIVELWHREFIDGRVPG